MTTGAYHRGPPPHHKNRNAGKTYIPCLNDNAHAKPKWFWSENVKTNRLCNECRGQSLSSFDREAIVGI